MTQQLTERMLNMPHAVAGRYARRETWRYEELVSEGNLALVKAAASFSDAGGRELSSWLMENVKLAIRQEVASDSEQTYRRSDGTERKYFRSAARWKRLASIGAWDAPGRTDPPAFIDREFVAAVLSRLSDADRATYVRRHADGERVADLAASLRVSPSTVKWRLARTQEKVEEIARNLLGGQA